VSAIVWSICPGFRAPGRTSDRLSWAQVEPPDAYGIGGEPQTVEDDDLRKIANTVNGKIWVRQDF